MEGEQQIQSHCSSNETIIHNFLDLPSLQYPWLVSHDYEEEEEEETGQIFSSISPHHSLHHHHYHCRIPRLHGRKIEGCFHGWLVLSKLIHSTRVLIVIELCLWNPVTDELKSLPVLKLQVERDDNNNNNNNNNEDVEEEEEEGVFYSNDIQLCYLSCPPYDNDSVLMLTRFSKPSIVFYALNSERKQWTELSYANETRKLPNGNPDYIHSLLACNGNTYASTVGKYFVQVDMHILVEQGVIKLLSLGMLPSCQLHISSSYLAGSHKELYTILVCYTDNMFQIMQSIKLFQLDFSTMRWEEQKNGNENRVFFLTAGCSTQISHVATELESGTCINIIRTSGEVYTYKMEDKTFSLSPLPCPDLSLGTWQQYNSTWIMPENRLVIDHGEANGRSDAHEEKGKEEEIRARSAISDMVETNNEQIGEETIATNEQGPLFRLPLDIFESIAEHCVFNDYLNFRATCKQFLLAARMCTSNVLARLQKSSPLLMVWDEDEAISTFTDPMSGRKYYTTIPELIGHFAVCGSRYGWLLVFGSDLHCPIFFNPFTKATIQLPQFHEKTKFTAFSSFAFSEPPTSPLCVVAAFSVHRRKTLILITSPGKQWRLLDVDADIPSSLSSYNTRIFFDNDIYILCHNGELGIVRSDQDFRWEILVDQFPKDDTYNMQHFLVGCGNHLLLLIVGEFGEWVEVFKLNRFERRWERVYDIGKYTIYVCTKACFSIVAKIPEMENKIYFYKARRGKLVFYSLSTCKYHTFWNNDEDEEEAFMNFFSTKENYLTGVWIEPDSSS